MQYRVLIPWNQLRSTQLDTHTHTHLLSHSLMDLALPLKSIRDYYNCQDIWFALIVEPYTFRDRSLKIELKMIG